MNLQKIVFLIIVGLFQLSCEKDRAKDELLLPYDLNVSVQKDEDVPGKVSLMISSKESNYYLVYFGETEGETPVNTKDSRVDYTYSSSGTYQIKVQAHALANAYITETTEVTIELVNEGSGGNGDDYTIPVSGYTTPESYEGMALAWNDEFDGEQLNLDDWTFETGTGSNGWGNNELQYYKEENTRVKDGFLIVTAMEESFEGMDFTSSRIKTQEKQTFQYGRIDIRAALPRGQGIWPALWMLGGNFPTAGWPACGEIDIMELIGGEGKDNTVHGTIHWSHAGEYANYGKGYTLETGIFADEFHVFSIVWDASSITWYVDDVEYNVVDITPEELSEFQQEFFLIFNVAVGGNWPGSPDANTSFPQHMIVDYVRVFQSE